MTDVSTDELRHQRRSSFGAVADEYERSRPDYPDEAVRWITAEGPASVLDLGAGTGKLTSQLAARGPSVVAVEPSAEMLHRLHAALPSLPAAVGRAEAIPCADRSFDLVTVAQAWHWFDQPAAADEVARVLHPGGHACILWNFRDESVDWVAKLSEIIGTEGTSEDETEDDPLGDCGAFGPSTKRGFSLDQPLDPDLLVALVKSRSYVAMLPTEEQAQVLDRVRRLCDEHPQLAGHTHFAMPYVTKVYRSEKLR